MRYAVASRKNTDSLVKGMILLDEGGGKRGGGLKVFDENGAPVSPLSACFFWVRALGFFLVVSRAQKKMLKIGGKLIHWTPYPWLLVRAQKPADGESEPN